MASGPMQFLEMSDPPTELAKAPSRWRRILESGPMRATVVREEEFYFLFFRVLETAAPGRSKKSIPKPQNCFWPGEELPRYAHARPPTRPSRSPAIGIRTRLRLAPTDAFRRARERKITT